MKGKWAIGDSAFDAASPSTVQQGNSNSRNSSQSQRRGTGGSIGARWLAGTPLPVETFTAGLERNHIELTEPALIEALQNADGEVRSLAAAQLAATDDHPALRYIVGAFQDERDPQVQVNIAGAAPGRLTTSDRISTTNLPRS